MVRGKDLICETGREDHIRFRKMQGKMGDSIYNFQTLEIHPKTKIIKSSFVG